MPRIMGESGKELFAHHRTGGCADVVHFEVYDGVKGTMKLTHARIHADSISPRKTRYMLTLAELLEGTTNQRATI